MAYAVKKIQQFLYNLTLMDVLAKDLVENDSNKRTVMITTDIGEEGLDEDLF